MKNMFLMVMLGGFAMLLTGCGSTAAYNGPFSYGYHDWQVSSLAGGYCASGWYDKQNCTQTYSPKKGESRSVSQTHTVGGYNVSASQTPVASYPTYTYAPTYGTYSVPTYNTYSTPTYGTYVPPSYSNYSLNSWGSGATTQPIGGYASTTPLR